MSSCGFLIFGRRAQIAGIGSDDSAFALRAPSRRHALGAFNLAHPGYTVPALTDEAEVDALLGAVDSLRSEHSESPADVALRGFAVIGLPDPAGANDPVVPALLAVLANSEVEATHGIIRAIPGFRPRVILTEDELGSMRACMQAPHEPPQRISH